MSGLRKLEAKAREIAQRISATLPPGVGFVLMLHDFGPNGWATFVSSGQREDTVAMLAETRGILWRVELPDDEPLVMVEVVNSTPESDGSLKDYFLRVPPAMQTAREAVAWTFDVPADQYAPVAES